MPKIDPLDFLTNREKYPDDMTLTLANGDEISVKEYRDRAMPKGDFTRASEGWARQKQDLEGNLQTAQQNLATAIRERQEIEARQATPQPQRTVPTGQVTPEDLLADPVLGPMYRELQDTRKEFADFQKTTQNRHQFYEQTWQRERFNGVLGKLRAQDPDLDVEGFLRYSQESPVVDVRNQTIDLEKTYRNFAHDRLVETASKTAEQKGIEKGREAARVPRVPMGRRSAGPTGAEAPQFVQDIKTDAVLNDHELMSTLRGDDAA